jgi:hypothetical protein
MAFGARGRSGFGLPGPAYACSFWSQLQTPASEVDDGLNLLIVAASVVAAALVVLWARWLNRTF